MPKKAMADNLIPDKEANLPETVFILGVGQRSGTNFLWQLLLLHPQCHVGSVGEDYLLKYSHLLKEYADGLYQYWNPIWRKRMTGSSDFLLSEFGRLLISFIRKPYYLYPGESGKHEKESADPDFETKTFITKTPCVKNLKNFFYFFPNARLLLMVRDGRSVVASGMKSFNWNFEDAVRRWNKSANEIIQFMTEHKDTDKKILLVRYEDLVNDTEGEVKKILNFLGLDHKPYAYDLAKNLPVFGSSETRRDGNEVHWNKIEKTKTFSPLNRWEKWEKAKHDRFNWLAGEAQAKLGYSPRQKERIGLFLSLKFKAMDFAWKYRKMLGHNRLL